MKSISKKLLSAVLSVSMIMGTNTINFPLKVTASAEMAVTVSLEGLTLGQGMYLEPETYTLSEINSILSKNSYSTYTEDNITASVAFAVALIDNGIEFNSKDFEDSSFYLSSVKGVDTGDLNIPQIIYDNSGLTNSAIVSNDDEWLGEMDYTSFGGWMFTINNSLPSYGLADCKLKDFDEYDNNYVIRMQFTISDWGSDLGFDNSSWGGKAPYFNRANKDKLYMKYAQLSETGIFENNPEIKDKALFVMEKLNATQEDVDNATDLLDQYEKSVLKVNEVIDDTLNKLSNKIEKPTFNDEWAILSLARSGYFNKDNDYFKGYYNRVVEEVEVMANEINENGALNKNKYTENSRLVIALSSIGKDSHLVGKWDILSPLENFTAVSKQGLNGSVFALIALDSQDYKTKDSTIRQKYIDHILGKEIDGGGWAFFGSTADVDMTSMVIQALAHYTDNPEVKSAVDRGINKLSEMQNDNGGYVAWGSESCENIAQVIVACTALGINPDTDNRFIKNGNSLIDALLRYYDASSTDFTFRHLPDGTVNNMATIQALYSLVSYQRLLNDKTSLYDMTDVELDTPVKFGGSSVSLSGNIGVNFHVMIDDSVLQDVNAYMQIELPDKNSLEIRISDAEKTIIDGVKYYIFPCEIPAKDIAENINFKFVLGNGAEYEVIEKYSVIDYAKEILEGSSSDEIKGVVKAMIDYGQCADAYFNNISVETPAETDSVTSELLADFAMSSDGTFPDGIEYYGSSLLLKSQTTLRHYFKVEDGTEVLSYNFSGNKGNYYYIDIENISSVNLGIVSETKIGDYTIVYSPLSYVYAVLNSDTASESLKTLVKTLYLYNMASVAYNA